jgi:hypothetical protein
MAITDDLAPVRRSTAVTTARRITQVWFSWLNRLRDILSCRCATRSSSCARW